jgi:hypothetical protein
MVSEYEFNVRKEIELAELRGDIEDIIKNLDIDECFLSDLERLMELGIAYKYTKTKTYRDVVADDQFNSRKDGY